MTQDTRHIARDIRPIVSVVLVLLAGSVALVAFATDYSSSNFIARDPTLDELGGYSSSTSFGQVGAGGDILAGRSTSTNFELRSGPLEFDTFTPSSQNWRWYADETNETPTSPLANENTAPTNIEYQDVEKLRLTITETAGIGLSGAKFRLQYSPFSDFSASVGDVVPTSTCSGSSKWCYADGGGDDNAVISTSTLSDADPCAGGAGNGCGTHNEVPTSTSSFTHTASTTREYEFTVKHSGADSNTVYYFRAFDVAGNSAVPLNTGESYPSLVTGGTQLSFSIAGLTSGTATEGVTTDITTTATAIPFGMLAIGTQIAGAQRLTVTTNSSQGYQVLLIEDQPFLNEVVGEIPGIAATNESPAGWSAACTATSSGCYGYHAGDDVLSASSTRFAANDTYARLETSTKEIAWSGIPVTDEVTDVVFKTQVYGTQENGSYQTGVTYIVVPTF